MDNKNDNINKKALKSGVWYTISHFLVKGMAFFTTPIFSRLLSKADFGTYSNFSSWYSLLAILVTLHLVSAASRAKIDYDEDYDEYISSVTFFGTMVTLICFGVIHLFPTFFENLFNLEMKYINVMFLLLLFSPGYDMLQIKRRFTFHYKGFVAVSLFLTVFSSLTAVFFVTTLDNKLDGRVYGTHIPQIAVYFIAFVLVMVRGKKIIRPDCWKYACSLSIPIIPHLMSNLLLNHSDKIMITKMIGKEANAIYSLSYSCGMIVAVMLTSLNQAMTPWLFMKLKEGDYDLIKKVNRVYYIVFILGLEALILIAPELMMYFGGEKYISEGVQYLVPPVMLGYGLKFVNTMYINVEQYNKKNHIVSIATLIAAAFNVVTNYIFIPIFGYRAAAYTTLAGFVLLFIIHFTATRKMGYTGMYDNRFNVLITIAATVTGLTLQVLYPFVIVRWVVIVLLGFMVLFLGSKMFRKYGLSFGRKNKGEKNGE